MRLLLEIEQPTITRGTFLVPIFRFNYKYSFVISHKMCSSHETAMLKIKKEFPIRYGSEQNVLELSRKTPP